MKRTHTLIVGACLSAALVGPVAAEEDAFGPLRQLAGSCWKADAVPLEICYRFDASGQTLYARQYVNGHVQSEASIGPSSRPGWLLETTRWAQSPYTIVQHLRIDPVGGRLWREPVRPLHHDDRGEPRGAVTWFVDSLKMVGTDRFALVRRTGAAVRDWRPSEPSVSSWQFTRSRPCDDEDLAAIS